MNGFVVVCSTGGSVLRAALADDAVREAVRLVLTDRPCGALAVAAEHGIAAVHEPWSDRARWSRRLVEHLDDAGCTDGVLFFTRLLDPPPSPRQLWNLHPSLLPAHPGRHGFEDSLDAGGPIGSTLHLIDAGMDTGPVLFRDAVERRPDDDATALRHRLFLLQVDQLLRLVAAAGGQRVVAPHAAVAAT